MSEKLKGDFFDSLNSQSSISNLAPLLGDIAIRRVGWLVGSFVNVIMG